MLTISGSSRVMLRVSSVDTSELRIRVPARERAGARGVLLLWSRRIANQNMRHNHTLHRTGPFVPLGRLYVPPFSNHVVRHL